MTLLVDFRTSADACEADLAGVAGLILAQLARRRPARRGLAGLIDRFDRKLLELRAVLSKFDREVRARGGERALDRADLEEKRHFRRLRQRLHAATRIAAALRLVQRGVGWPLYPHVPPRHDLMVSRVAILEAAMMALHRVVNPAPQSRAAEAQGAHPDIPHDAAAFAATAHAAWRVAQAMRPAHPLRFLDVGCGGGMMVLLASGLFSCADGFDLDPAYVAAANAAFTRMRSARCHAFEANALTFDRYADYDVIYFYQPIWDSDLLREMENRIIASARPGTVIAAPYRRFHARWHELDCARIEEPIYVTGLEADAAAKLRSEARRIGPDIHSPDRPILPGMPDWLRDLWLGVATSGYLPD
jgi:SAM-dependent methyltransferase